MSTASTGRNREYRVRDNMLNAGWLFVMRAAASKGAADLLLAHPDHGAALVQVGTANKKLGPADRLRLITAADMCGALALVCTVIEQRGRPTVYRYWAATLDAPSTWQEFAL